MIDNHFPNERLTQETLDCPIFISDIQNATQEVLAAMKAVCGLNDTDFAIITGLDYTVVDPYNNTYNSGIVYMAGVFYSFSDTLHSGYYLTPANEDVENKLHSDSNAYATYRLYKAIESSAQYGTMPIFTGTMDNYRIGSKQLKALLDLKVTSALSDDVIVTVNSGFQVDPSNALRYRKNAIGQTKIIGGVKKVGSPPTEVIFELGAAFRPEEDWYGFYFYNAPPITSNIMKIDSASGAVESIGSWPSSVYAQINITL